jgi:hypothetical protein
LTESADISAINLTDADTLTINGQGAFLDVAGAYRGLFAYSGSTTIENLMIEDAVARGGFGGGGRSGGGGAGLGGGLFVANNSAGGAVPAHVTLDNVFFTGDPAINCRGNPPEMMHADRRRGHTVDTRARARSDQQKSKRTDCHCPITLGYCASHDAGPEHERPLDGHDQGGSARRNRLGSRPGHQGLLRQGEGMSERQVKLRPDGFPKDQTTGYCDSHDARAPTFDGTLTHVNAGQRAMWFDENGNGLGTTAV